MHDSGQVERLRQFKDGEPADGLQTMWHENGQKRTEATIEDGEQISAKSWNSKGEEVETVRVAQGSESASEKPTAPSEEVKPVEEKQQEVKPEEPVAETEKPELTLKERVVGKWDFGGVTLIFDKNGTAKAMRGGNLIGGRTWFIKDGKIHTISDGPAKTVVIYVMNEDGNLQHPSRGEAKRIKTEDN